MSAHKLGKPEMERIIGALQAGADMASAAKLVGVARSALYKLIERDKVFAERAEEARRLADSVVVQKLYKQACAGNVAAMIFWLKNRQSAEWRDRQVSALENPDGTALAPTTVTVRLVKA